MAMSHIGCHGHGHGCYTPKNTFSLCCRPIHCMFIRCVDCRHWTHIDCVSFCDYVSDVRPIDFVRRTCISTPNSQGYNWEKSLIRLAVDTYRKFCC